MKHYLTYFLLIALLCCNINMVPCRSFNNSHKFASLRGPVSIEKFGAVAGDTLIDNSPAIIKAINSTDSIFIPSGKRFTIRSAISVKGLSNKFIKATGATVINCN